jgi:hypothetical protein
MVGLEMRLLTLDAMTEIKNITQEIYPILRNPEFDPLGVD